MKKPSPGTTRGLIKCKGLEIHSSRKENTNQGKGGLQIGGWLFWVFFCTSNSYKKWPTALNN